MEEQCAILLGENQKSSADNAIYKLLNVLLCKKFHIDQCFEAKSPKVFSDIKIASF